MQHSWKQLLGIARLAVPSGWIRDLRGLWWRGSVGVFACPLNNRILKAVDPGHVRFFE